MNHIGDYLPSKGEKFVVMNYSGISDHPYNGKIVTFEYRKSDSRYGYYVRGLFKNPDITRNLSKEELGFLVPKGLDEWM